MVTETYLSPQPLPGWLLSIFPKRQATGGVKDSAHGVDDVIPERQRNSRLTSMGGAMRRQGMTQEEIEVALLAVNTSRCRPPLPEEEVRKIAWSVGRYAPAPDVASVSTNGQGPKEAVGTPWPEPMAQEAFYGLAGDIVKTIEPHTEADRSALLINFLVYFGNEVATAPTPSRRPTATAPTLMLSWLVGRPKRGKGRLAGIYMSSSNRLRRPGLIPGSGAACPPAKD